MAGGGDHIVTRVRIDPGDELFCDYGVSYWKSKGLRKSELQKPKPCVALASANTLHSLNCSQSSIAGFGCSAAVAALWLWASRQLILHVLGILGRHPEALGAEI